jgi:hypothetical protein
MQSGIIYNGPSLLDGKPIVVIGTYSNRNSAFSGHVLQTYILREDISPLEASKTGEDYSICGSCKFRGTPTDDPNRKQAIGRDCYVNLGQGPTMVWKAYKRGVYDPAEPRLLGRNKKVRVGAYGDPGAAPEHIWDELLSECIAFNAYTHQSGWRPDIAMQSVESHLDAWQHWKQGRRTYRVITGVEEIDSRHEVLCPKSKEAGRRSKCDDCLLCAGFKQAKSIAIVEH